MDEDEIIDAEELDFDEAVEYATRRAIELAKTGQTGQQIMDGRMRDLANILALAEIANRGRRR